MQARESVARRGASSVALGLVAHEGPASVDRHDEALLTEFLHSAAHGPVGHAVMSGQVPLRAQSRARRQLSRGDAGSDVVSDPDVDEIVLPSARRRDITHPWDGSYP